MFLDETFAHKWLLIKRSLVSVPRLLAWVYRELCVNIWYQFERIIHSICADLPSHYKLVFLRHYTMPCAHQSQIVAHAC